jgi:hypothetical protein
VNQPLNDATIGATGTGKTQDTAREVIESEDAEVVLDPEKDSLAATVMPHLDGTNVLYDRLDDPDHTLPFDIVTRSTHPDPETRRDENQAQAEKLSAILLRRRGEAGMAASPLMEENTHGAIGLWMCQAEPKPLEFLPYAFLPGTPEFTALINGCTSPELCYKFRQLETLSYKGLRSEVGSASRLVNGVFRSRAFTLRSRGGFDLGAFLQACGKLVIEGGDASDDVKRTILGMIVLKVVEHAKRRAKPWPIIRIRIDEANSAGLVGGPELKGIATTRKYGVFWQFCSQQLDYPGGHVPVLTNCKRHKWFACPSHDLARKAAEDILGSLPVGDASRAERMNELTHDVMTLKPGWRWNVEGGRAWKEYKPMLEHPFPDWPDLRQAKLEELLCRIRSRPEYSAAASPSATGSRSATPPRDKSPGSSSGDASPADRLTRLINPPGGGSASSEGGRAADGSP